MGLPNFRIPDWRQPFLLVDISFYTERHPTLIPALFQCPQVVSRSLMLLSEMMDSAEVHGLELQLKRSSAACTPAQGFLPCFRRFFYEKTMLLLENLLLLPTQ